MSAKLKISAHLILLILLLTSCSPAPTSSSPTSTFAQSTTAPVATPGSQSSLFQADVRYSDTPGDMEIPFLDVVAFQASVDEEAETLEVTLHMQNIPENALRGQVKNLSEYSWMIFVFLDPSASAADMPGDYYLVLNTTADDLTSESLTPIPGTPVSVPVHQLFENRFVYNSSGMDVSEAEVNINPDLDKLTITGQVPGITSNAVFSFSTDYHDGTADKPDGAKLPISGNSATPRVDATVEPPTGEEGLHLEPIGAVRTYPGPEIYTGDIVTFGIQADPNFADSFAVSMALDEQQPTEVPEAFYWFGEVIVPSALDTTDLIGHHTIKFTTSDGNLNESYSFEVLPANQRPANEVQATWMVREADCCIFHYISGTAAARDIDFIAEHFQQGANDFEAVMRAEIQSKLDVYIMDRILGNGGFGGGGKLVISYTDRYYGPTMGGAGLETLARHEFSHAADIGLENTADGIDFNYEGLAVYVAGGHYKPEPLARRGAALFDLGRSAPVNDFIPQHELSYLHAALILTYITETYGEEKLWAFLNADDTRDDQLLPMEDAIQLTFGVSLDEFDRGFQTWLERNDPGEQLDDLRLTIELQDARREYQNTYSPGPFFLLFEDIDAVARPENLPVVMREAHPPANIAIELLIANAQRAIISGAYAEAEQFIETIKNVVSTGHFENPLAKEYLNIVLAAEEAGYEVVSLNIQNGYATAQVTQEPPTTSILLLRNVNGTWQIEP